jgi:hypothetical protein
MTFNLWGSGSFVGCTRFKRSVISPVQVMSPCPIADGADDMVYCKALIRLPVNY